jgi:hypothetical protein
MDEKLKAAVQKMIDAGEPEANIANFIKSYSKPAQQPTQEGVETKAIEPKGAQAEGSGDSVSPSVDMNYSSESNVDKGVFALQTEIDNQTRKSFYDQLTRSTTEELERDGYSPEDVPATYQEYSEKNPTYQERINNAANVFEEAAIVKERDEKRKQFKGDLYERTTSYAKRKKNEIAYAELQKENLSEAEIINAKSEVDRINSGDLTLYETMKAYTLGAIERFETLDFSQDKPLAIMPTATEREVRLGVLDKKKIKFMKDLDAEDRADLTNYMQNSPDGSDSSLENLSVDVKSILKESSFLEDRMIKYSENPVYRAYQTESAKGPSFGEAYIESLSGEGKSNLLETHTKIMDLYEIHQKNMEDFNLMEEDLQSYEVESELSRKHFGLGSNLAYGYVNSFFGIMGGALNAALDPIVELARPEGQSYADYRKEIIDGTLLNYMEESVEENQKVSLGRRLNDSWYSLDRLALLAAEQIPVLATVATGSGGIGVIAASTYGNKVKGYSKDGDVSMEERIGAAFAAGGEVLSERVSFGIMKKGGRAFIAARNQGKLRDIFTPKFVLGTAGTSLEEGGTELLAKLAENFADIYIVGDKSKNMLEGLEEAFIDGAIMGGMMRAAPEIVGSTLGQFYGDTGQINKIRSTDAAIQKLTKEAMKDGVSDETFDILERRVSDLMEQNKKRVNTYLGNIDKLTQEEVSSLSSIAKTGLREKASLDAIEKDPSLSEDVKADLSRVYKNRLKVLEESKQDLLRVTETRPEAKPKEKAPKMREGSISPEDSSNYANLTEDGDEYVFFHNGAKGYSEVKPSTGGTTVTSKEESAALSKVGGMAMYFTDSTDSERQNATGAKYAVRVSKDKVYDFNSDPLNLIEEAEKRHTEEHPSKAFDKNTQLAYITKIAGEKGFDMVVSEWNNGTRAQTTKALKPSDTMEMDGNVVKKSFSKEYTGNRSKGFESVIPMTKKGALKESYEAINKAKNAEGKYDDLYRLVNENSNYSQKEITEMIESSDLSQELKDQYKEAVAFKPEGRSSRIVEKTDGVKVGYAPKGTYINVGLKEGSDGKEFEPSRVEENLPEDVEVVESGVSVVESEGSTERTVSMRLSRPLTDLEMKNLLTATKQDAIPQISDGTGVMFGTKDYGVFDPQYFSMPDNSKLTENDKGQGTTNTAGSVNNDKPVSVSLSRVTPSYPKEGKEYYDVEVKSSDGSIIPFSNFAVEVDTGSKQARVSDVNKDFGKTDKNKGAGKKAYIELAKILGKKGFVLQTTNASTKGSRQLWESLVEDGLAKKKVSGFTAYSDAFMPRKLIENEQNKTKGKDSNTKGKEGSGKEGPNRSNPKNAKGEPSGKAKAFAAKIRTYKTNTTLKDAMSSLNSGIPKEMFEIAWDAAIEVTAQTAELTGNIAQSVHEGVESLKGSEWYESLSTLGRSKAIRMMTEDMNRQFGEDEVNNASFLDSMKASYGKTKEFVIQKFIDKFNNVKVAIKENYKDSKRDSVNFSRAEKLMHGKAVNDLEIFDAEMTDVNKRVLEEGFTMDQMSNWMYAKHAEERNKHITDNIDPENMFGSGMTPQMVKKILEETHSPEDMAKLEDLAIEYQILIEGTRKMMLDFGLITEEQFNAFSEYYDNYVPLQDFEINQSSKDRKWHQKLFGVKNEAPIETYTDIIGQSFSVDGKLVRRSGGRSTKAGNIIASIMKQRVNTVLWARKNEVLEKLYNLKEEQPDQGVFELYKEDEIPTSLKIDKNGKQVKTPDNVMGDNSYVGIKVKGEQFYMKFENKELGRILNSANIEKTDLITNSLGKLNRYLSTTLTTLDPEFVISNFARDIQTAIYNLKAEGDINDQLDGKDLTDGIIRDSFKAIAAIYGNERSGKVDSEFRKWYKEFKAQGAKTGFANQNSLSDIKKKLDGLEKMKDAKGVSLANAREKFKDALAFVEDVNTSVENGVRLAAYINARKAGLTKAQAAEIAKELTVNFNQSGEYGTLFNSLFLFFNASIQGSARFAKAMGTMKKTTRVDGTVKKSLNRGQKLAMIMTTFGATLTALNQVLSADDEDGESFYSKIPDYEKERNLIFMDPTNGIDHYKLPLPYGYNIFHNLGTILTEVSTGERKVGDGIGFLMSATISSFVPVSFGGSEDPSKRIVSSISPTIAKPFVNLAINEDFFGSEIYNENFPFGTPKPDSAMGRKNTPQAYKSISKFLNEFSGGDEFESGGLDFAPESLYYLAKFFTGGTGRFISNIAETAGSGIDAIQGKPADLELRKIPFVRKVYAQPNEFVDQSTFFDRYDMIRQRSKSLSAKIKDRTISPEERSVVSRVKATENFYKETAKRLSEIRDQKKEAEKIKSPIRRAQRINDLDDRYFKEIKKANRNFNRRLGPKYD